MTVRPQTPIVQCGYSLQSSGWPCERFGK